MSYSCKVIQIDLNSTSNWNLFSCMTFFFLFFFTSIFCQENDSILIDQSYQAGIEFYKKSEYSNAIQYWKKELNLKEKYFGTDHLEVARTNYNLGSAYWQLNMYEQSKTHFNRSLFIRLPHFDLKDKQATTNILNTYKFLGESLKELGDFDQALLIYDASLSKINENHPSFPGLLKYTIITRKKIKNFKR